MESNPGIPDTSRRLGSPPEDDSGDDSESDDEVGAQAPPLTKQISNILNRYPEGGQILKELIQNADDAQATEVGFLIDWRHHPTDDVMFRNFEQYQGPALYAWNNAVFKERDWHSLGKINQSSKEEDVLKVGRFGLGFQSVFHITDLPMVISQKYIAVIDPHRKCISPKSETSPAGTKKRLSSLFKHKGHVSTFESIFGLSVAAKEYSGTIFRFPLRQPESNSDISNKVYEPKMIQTMLFESLKEESPYILLFLRKVKSISLMEWTESASQPHEMFRVTAVDQSAGDMVYNCEDDTSLSRCEVYAKQCSQNSEAENSEVYVELKSTTVTITNFHDTDNISEQHHWLVLKMVGSNDNELDKLGKELSILPWVGLATRLPTQIALCTCETTTTLPFDDHTTIQTVYEQLKSSLCRTQLPLKWSNADLVDVTPGHAYCFLPLPECTAMPVHVHGYFAVTDNRRSIKWPAHDEKGKEAQWNRELLYKMVAPAYALLLVSRSSLFKYEDTPLPIVNTDNVTDAYSTWPLYQEVKNVQIWNELLSPTLGFSSLLPLLWTSASGGRWVKLDEAYYLPGSFCCSADSPSCNSVVSHLLISVGIPVVSLPRKIIETIQRNPSVLEIVHRRVVSPQFVREAIRKNSGCCSSLSKEEVSEMLEFILFDLSAGNFHYLVDIPLLPLKGVSSMTVFQKPTFFNRKFVFPSKLRQLLEIIPGTDDLIVDPELPDSILERLCDIAGSKLLQIEEVNTDAMCTQLLPKSIDSWCTKDTAARVEWTPGRSLMPPRSWLASLWKWIAEAEIPLSSLEQLPILPQLPYEESDNQEEGVSLIKVSKSVKMCQLSSSLNSRQRSVLLSIMRKLDFLIVDTERMINLNSMKNHVDFDEYVPELSTHSELILKYLDSLNVTSRLSAIQCLDDCEKGFIRQLSVNLQDSSIRKYLSCLRSIPIYHAAGSNELSSRLISLNEVDSDEEAFLPPDDIPPLPDHPSSLLCPATCTEERLFYETLKVKKMSVSDLSVVHLIPLALKHLLRNPQSWGVGDDLILWILKQHQQLCRDVLESLSQHEFLLCGNYTRKKPQDMYDPQDTTLTLLFDVHIDKEYFPENRYVQEAHHRSALTIMGMKTWKDLQKDHSQMCKLLLDRMNSVYHLQHNIQLSRGQFILQTLIDHDLHLRSSLKAVRFLKAEMCPWSYPSSLKEKWCGQMDKLYSIEELCPPDSNNHCLIGTVLPVLSHDYCLGAQAVSVNVFQKLPFQKVNSVSVLKHLENLQSTTVVGEAVGDVTKFDQIVISVYEYLLNTDTQEKLSFIWWKDKPGFMPANKFVLDLSTNIQFNLEPFYYDLRAPICHYAQLFRLHGILTLSDAAEIVKGFSKQATEKLTSKQIALCVSLLNWLCENQYIEPNMLMLTEAGMLLPAKECVFDDREWMKHSKSREHIKGKSLAFVHDQVPQKVAKHFHVVPLSSKVAPSQKLKFGLSYIRAGQYEDITQRIRHIVQDYETNIDIFKELIQNADDAGATEVKFLIDWRRHPTESLFGKEMEEWQGSGALIAYNNAIFSDEDFENICKVAGETKKKDPLKTGRFGVGFCATYHLTDLPSFISRRYFTMFDPHTTYLKDRISSQAPGMRIDLVENRADLNFYHDQFEPYESIFDCKVFDLSDDGYQGTLFRFPFRCQHTSLESKICKTIYTREHVSALIGALKEQSSELLLFLKHVNVVSVYELESGQDPSAAPEIFSVRRTSNSLERIQLIKMGNTDKTCSATFNIEVRDGGKIQSQKWLLSSAVKPLSCDMQTQPETSGLLNLAEVALQIDSSGEGLKIVPNTDSNPSKVFCFLPLPIQCKLPFQVNGFFSIGKDRRNVSATDDKTFGSLWNKSLAEGALVSAFAHLLQCLCKECDLKSVSNPNTIETFLHCYYSLWNMNKACGLVGSSFAAAFKKFAPTMTCPVMWSEINGGCWLPPVSVYVFRDNKANQSIIEKDAIALLLKQGYGVAHIPYNIYETLKRSLIDSNRQYDYKKVCTELLFPVIHKLDTVVRERNIKFLIEGFGVYLGEDNWLKWAEFFIKQQPCISCEGSNTLRPACELIDPTVGHFMNLFEVKEGRFPCKELQDSSKAMHGLRCLGMTSSRLSIVDLKERAQSVSNIAEYEDAIKRAIYLCEYIGSTYYQYIPKFSHYASTYTKQHPQEAKDEQELRQLSDISFLPVKPKPENVDVPWSGTAKGFDCPSRMYTSDKESLIFTQCSVVEVSKFSSRSLLYLGLSSKEPTVNMVVDNLKCIIDHLKGVPSEATTEFLDDAIREIYSYLQYHQSSPEVMKMLAKLERFIWQNGCFLSPNQVVGHWKHDCVPYLCELSSSNKRFSELMTRAGVKNEETLEILVKVLQKIASDHDAHVPISNDILEFIVHLSGRIRTKLSGETDPHSLEIYLPDEDMVMRNVSDLADNISSEWLKSLSVYQDFMDSGNGFYVHKSIPRECAVKLGVKPLLEAVLKEIEDEDFLSGTDFGQHEDLCDRLNGILRKYPPDTSIFKEFMQNADDAQATEIIFILDRRTNFPEDSLLSSSVKWKSLQSTPALCIYNNRKFTEADIEGITKLGRGGKTGSAELIGKFGIGFNVAYHVTDCPSFVSYSESESPEYLCVFDPTQSFVARHAKGKSPGRKWNFKGKDQHLGFSDQFKPYLAEDLPRLAGLVSNCLQDPKKHGHVVFRLPLTRISSRYDTTSTKPALSEGCVFTPRNINMLFQEFSKFSQDILLFLNHLRSVSAFEIDKDGSIHHHFTTNSSIPSSYLGNCKHFSESLKKFSQTRQIMQWVSVTHKMEVTHIKPDYKTVQTEWLIQRVIGGSDLSNKLVQAGLTQGLRPIAGVATMLKPPPSSHKYLLFCFLPLPIQSNLPVHVNGHFLLDDSRKHLETIDHVGLKKWNEAIAHKAIVPAYVDLIIAIKDLINVSDEGELAFYYSLFPKESTDQSNDATADASHESKDGGELGDLNIVRTFYAELLKRNPPVLIREVPSSVPASLTWMNVKSSLFCVSRIYKNTVLDVSEKLRRALVTLGMPITNAPSYVYYQCKNVDSTFTDIAAIEPRKVTEHLQRLRCTSTHEESIKENIVGLLRYCISGYDAGKLPSLFSNALYLVAEDGSLQRGYLFQSKFSKLLPNCSKTFVDKSLEASRVGQQLSQCNVIRSLPMEFVSKHIELPKTSAGHELTASDSAIVRLLWDFIIHCSKVPRYYCESESVSSQLIKYFSLKAIFPATDGNLYPVCLSKILVRNSTGYCHNCCVMRKLGYPQIDFNKIGMDGQRHIFIEDLTSCFQKGEDIVNCFKLQAPKRQDIELTEEEVFTFTSTLGIVSVNSLRQVSRYLLEMPLFHTIDGSRLSLHGVTKVFILASTDLPLEGIHSSHNGQIVLKAATTDSIKNFYAGVIPSTLSATVSPEEFYLQLVLPILHKLETNNIEAHLDYLYRKREMMKTAYNRLKDTPFIKHNDKFYTPRELCIHTKPFYTTFKPDDVLPVTWKDKVHILLELGLQSKVSPGEWLQCAKRFSQNVKPDKAKHKSTVLLGELVIIIDNQHTLPIDFLQNVADIKFIYSPQTWELKSILNSLFRSQKNNDQYMVKFEGSVSFHEADLACLCKSVIPESCQQLATKYKQHLFVELPASPKTVAENLKRLCSCINVSCGRSISYNSQTVDKLIQIIEAHYACLSITRPPPDILCELKDMMCILQPKNQLLQLVKPTQLVIQLPSDCFLAPYCFKVESWLQKYVDFLKAVGVKEELKAQDYVKILTCIKQEADDESVAQGKETRGIKCAYKALVSCLRRGDKIDGGDNIYLPDESLNLTKVAQLCLNDVPWYKSRLPDNFDLRMILPPPTDDKGHRTLPESLKVKRLSEIVTEDLLESCKSSDFNCNEEELYKVGKRPQSGRCLFVANILETLNSDELFHGFCRMYYSEYKCPPTEPFKVLVQKLKQLTIHCVVGDLKSVLSINGQPIPGTEDTSKLCQLCREENKFVLYIAPHNSMLIDSDLAPFFKDLAVCVCKLIDNEIKNMGPVAAMFACLPHEIPQILTREQIYDYSEEDNEVAKAIKLGVREPWCNISPQESLIILNFDAGDLVRFISENGSLVNAEVVNGGHFEIMENKIEIKVKETMDEDDVKDANKFVSPLQVFKLLTAPQKRSLWKGSISPYAVPVALATVPSEEPTELEQWLGKIKHSYLVSPSGLSQAIQTLHLISHLHYQLVIHNKDLKLFSKASLEIKQKFQYVDDHTSQQTTKVMRLILSILDKVTSGTLSDRSQAIFPNEALGQIIDHGGSGTPDATNIPQSPGHCVTSGHLSSGYSSSSGVCLPQYVSSSSRPAGSHGNQSNQAVGSSRPAAPSGGQFPSTMSSRFQVHHRPARSRRGHQYPRYQWYTTPHYSVHQVEPHLPQPDICMRSATAWLQQAKADYIAAESLLGSCILQGSETELKNNCRFPALVCFLCHDTVEKCIKGVCYAFCGLRQDLVNCSNLKLLHDALKTMPHHPAHLMEPMDDCVMTVNRHENRSRFPNFQNPPCAPATIYDVEDAQEALQATSKFLNLLQSEEKLCETLQDLGQLPARRFMSILQSLSDNQDYPDNWDPMQDTEEWKLFLLDQLTECEEYERVTTQFLLTLPSAHILRVERVQNKVLWKRYFNRSKLIRDFDRTFLREELLFHGTRYNRPDLIYAGGEGFDTRFSSEGFWGRGNYFAVNSSYSDRYAFRSNGTHKMFAAWVLTGNSICLHSDRSLTKPPFVAGAGSSNSSIQRRYDSVYGTTGGTRVYITYDNEHAYPAYLITYTN